MSDVSSLILNEQYLALLGVSLFFSALTIFVNLAGYKKQSDNPVFRYGILSIISAMCWIISGIVHLAVSPTTSPLPVIAYLFFAFGVVFSIVTIADITHSIRDAENQAWGNYNK